MDVAKTHMQWKTSKKLFAFYCISFLSLSFDENSGGDGQKSKSLKQQDDISVVLYYFLL